MKKFIVILGLAFYSVVHAQTFLTNGLVAYYLFSGNANDASGNANNGTPQNVRFVSDRNGLPQGALSCPSNNSCIIIPNSASL